MQTPPHLITASHAQHLTQPHPHAQNPSCRIDGRGQYVGRPVALDIAPDDHSVTVAFGETRVLATLRAELHAVQGASKDGRLLVEVKPSPMASKAFETVRCGSSCIPCGLS